MGRDFDMDEIFEAYDYPYGRNVPRRHRNKRRPFLTFLCVLLVLAVLVASFLYISVLLPHMNLTDDIQVARVQAISTDVPGHMDVTLTLYDKNGQQTSDSTFLVQGQYWMLQASAIKMNIPGPSSGYELTPLEGRDKDGQVHQATLISSINNENVQMKGDEDKLYSTMRSFPLLAKVTDTQVYASAGPKPGGTTYNVFMSSKGNLYVKVPG